MDEDNENKKEARLRETERLNRTMFFFIYTELVQRYIIILEYTHLLKDKENYDRLLRIFFLI